MVEYIKSLIKKYPLETIFCSISIFSLIIAIVVLIFNFQAKTDQEIEVSKSNVREEKREKIFVDLSGMVEKPDIYELEFGARLKDVLIKAGGLSADADRDFFAKNFNLARVLSDQEKIYIPSTKETLAGYQLNSQSNVAGVTSTNQNLININAASIEELDKLPGIGKVTAEKIIRGRPYQTIEELLSNKIVSKSVYEKIKALIKVE